MNDTESDDDNDGKPSCEIAVDAANETNDEEDKDNMTPNTVCYITKVLSNLAIDASPSNSVCLLAECV